MTPVLGHVTPFEQLEVRTPLVREDVTFRFQGTPLLVRKDDAIHLQPLDLSFLVHPRDPVPVISQLIVLLARPLGRCEKLRYAPQTVRGHSSLLSRCIPDRIRGRWASFRIPARAVGVESAFSGQEVSPPQCCSIPAWLWSLPLLVALPGFVGTISITDSARSWWEIINLFLGASTVCGWIVGNWCLRGEKGRNLLCKFRPFSHCGQAEFRV